MKKQMYFNKNKFKVTLQVNKVNFTTTSYLHTDKGDIIRALGPKIVELSKLNKEKTVLEEDKDLIGDAIRAASKYESQEIPTEQEKKALEDLSNEYSAFFESDDSESEKGPSSLLGKIMQIKSYLRSELRTNKEQKDVTRQEMNLINAPVQNVGVNLKGKKRAMDQSENEPKGKRRATDQIEEESKEKGKEKATSESGESSSKKEIQSFNDFIDDIYSDYNPFDDIGND